MSLLTATLALFFVMDPIGNVALWPALMGGVEPKRRRWVIVRENLIALGVLIAFLFAGPAILWALNVQMPALETAGGVVLFLIALRMIYPVPAGAHPVVHPDEPGDGEPLIVPLAIPLLAGPSSMATVMLLASQAEAGGSSRITVLGALLAAWAAGLVILLAGDAIAPRLGRRGIVALERLMGMLLAFIAVQMVFTGIGRFIESMPTR